MGTVVVEMDAEEFRDDLRGMLKHEMMRIVRLERLRCAQIAAEYDGDGVTRTSRETQCGDAHVTKREIEEKIMSGGQPECGWTEDMMDEHCTCEYHTLKREILGA